MNDIVYVGKHSITNYVSLHAHANYEIILCTSGGGEMIFQNYSISYHSGDLLVVPPLLPHTNKSSEGFTNIFMNISNCTLNNSEPMIISNAGNDFLLEVFKAAFGFYSCEENPSMELLASFGSLIVTYIQLYHPDVAINELSRKIKNEIIHNFTDGNFDLSAYMHTLPFSYDYLIKIFKKDLSVTPHKYLMDMRLRSAAKLLKSDNGSNIADIAFMSGFKDALYFSRMFKKQYGVSPKSYSKQPDTVESCTQESMKIYEFHK